MDYLDCILCTDNYIVCAYPGQICVGKQSVINNTLFFDKDECLWIAQLNFKFWSKMFQDFLKAPGKFKDTSLEKENSVRTYKCTIRGDRGSQNGDLTIKFEHLKREGKPFYLTFSIKSVYDILIAMSHMFVPSLCLPSESAMVFNGLFGYFRTHFTLLDAVQEIKKLSTANLYKIVSELTKGYQFQTAPGQITTILLRYERCFFELFKARFCVEVQKLIQQQEEEEAAGAAITAASRTAATTAAVRTATVLVSPFQTEAATQNFSS